MESNASLLEFRRLGFRYEAQAVFTDLNLTIRKGEVVGLLGLSGSGKSTLLKLACGLLAPNSGAVERNPALTYWGYLAQGANLIPWLTVNDNLKLITQEDTSAWSRAQEWLDKFRLVSFADKYPHELSGGMAQKVALIRAFVHQPEVVLLDEPFSHLDLPQKEELYAFAKTLWTQSGATVVIVTHDIDEVLMLTRTIYVCSQRQRTLIPTETTGLTTTSLEQLRRHSDYPRVYGHLLQHLQRELQSAE